MSFKGKFLRMTFLTQLLQFQEVLERSKKAEERSG
jgi:hypothetical protein